MLPEIFTTKFLHKLELLKLRSRRSYLGTRQGGHASIKRGHGIEFSDYRKYELGDSPRHIDWGLYARSERLYVKRFKEDQDLSVFIALDGTQSMHVPEANSKWTMGRDLALSIAYVALMQHDRVSLCVPGISDSPPYSGAKAIHRFGEQLLKLDTSTKADFVSGMARSASRIRFPGIAIIISDLLMPFEDIQHSINLLRAKNLDISVIQVLGPEDVDPLQDMDAVVAIDSESGREIQLDLDKDVREEYGYLLVQHNKRLQNFFAESRIAYTLALSTQALDDFVVDNLSKSGLLS